ncbi:Nn.00g052940.m01.CDS01 [Neocucurbitaria sp. VM-36]
MPATRRQRRTNGCWTCKLRRKKCDELQPSCGPCNNLEITCNYGPKPTWMDGGTQQGQATTLVKNEIKQKAAYRREKANTSNNAAHDPASHQFNVIRNMMVSDNLLSLEPPNSSMLGMETLTPGSSSATSPGTTHFGVLPYHGDHRCSSTTEQTSAVETDFIMKYIDFVFPALFPFYRSTFFETGRSWLLMLLGKSKIAYHSTVSLSCYFFTMALRDADIGDEYVDCKHLRWMEVEEQTNKCFESIRTDILALDLIFIDVIASTTIREPPKLLKYHSNVLAQVDDGSPIVGDAEVCLSNIMGCRNWVIQSIADISALDSWKREQIETDSLSVVELVDRASSIANKLSQGILDIQKNPNSIPPLHPDHGTRFDRHPSPYASSKSTLIWAYAAQLYLTVVVSGWQPSNTEIRVSVAKIIGLLQTVPSYHLRALAWPLCVSGCLAVESEESSFTALLLDQGRINTAGALDDARQIMEQVWQIRTTLHGNTWNLASCFSILGSPILLA